MATLLAALLCFVLAAVGYDAVRNSNSAAAPWLFGAVVAFGICTLLMGAAWTIRGTTRHRRRR